MKTSHILTTLAVVAVLAIANVAAAATQGEGQGEGQALKNAQIGQQNGQMEEVKQAIENNDYNAWVELTTGTPRGEEMLEKINADNFYLLSEMHQARQSGDIEKAKEIADQLGIEAGPFGGERMGKEGRGMGKQMNEEVQTALQNRDYNAWKEAMMPPVFQYVNEGNFDTFADMHEAIKAGDTATAETLRTQLGLPEREIGAGKGRQAAND
ncbi:hypothetical protein C0416_01330 [bacterium]|nr:hypothetical protein [bacterium]